MKNVVELQMFHFPWELEHAIEEFVIYYNNERYHEPLDNLTPADVYFGRDEEVKKDESRSSKQRWKSDANNIDKAFMIDYICRANPPLF